MATILENNFEELRNQFRAEEAQVRESSTTGKLGGSGSDRSVLLETAYLEVVLDRRHNLLRARWLRPVISSEYRHGIKEIGRLLQELGVEQLLVNNQRLGMLTIADQGWLARTSVEAISKSRLQRLAIVSSTDILQELTNEVLDSKVKQQTPPFQTEYFLSEQDAFEWFRQF